MVVDASGADAPSLTIKRTHGGTEIVVLDGAWNLRGLEASLPELGVELKRCAAGRRAWDLQGVERLDSTGAVLLWRAWGGTRPTALRLKPEHEILFSHLDELPPLPAPERASSWRRLIDHAASPSHALVQHLIDIIALAGELALATGYVLTHPSRIPWLEISAHIRHAGVRALGITAIVGFLIGVVLSYLSAMELQLYGAQGYIVNVLGIGVTREMGPLLAAILVAGRSGSAITAQLGVMRLTQELDALEALGIPPAVRLILPRTIALVVVMPLLVLWTDALGILGGMFAAGFSLQMPFARFLSALPRVVPVFNLWIGLGKGAVFGVVIALIASHHGLRVRPNTESLGAETTNAVVTAITVVILVDAVFAIVFREVGWW